MFSFDFKSLLFVELSELGAELEAELGVEVGISSKRENPRLIGHPPFGIERFLIISSSSSDKSSLQSLVARAR